MKTVTAIGRRCALLLAAALLGACATPGVAPVPPQARQASDVAALGAIAAWQRQLDAHVAAAGGRDPAVLSQQPALRSPVSLRPARIEFSATDVGATAAGRDGYDVGGQLVGSHDAGGARWHLFVVGTVERSGHRPAALIDVRVVARSLRDGEAVWIHGPADPAALERYARHLDPRTALRFPGEVDRFRVVDCAPQWCVEEAVSGAAWRLDPATAAAPPGR
jgi:hypothetical protein